MRIRQICAFIGYWSGLDALFYWLNRKAKRVLTFHNVLPDELFSQAPIVGPIDKLSDFMQIIKIIGKRFPYSVDINDPKTATITFDDGYLNEYEIAGNWLIENDIPAILFVSGKMIDAAPQKCLAVDKALLWCACAQIPEKYRVWEGLWHQEFEKDGDNRGENVIARMESLCTFSTIMETLPKEWVRLRLSGVKREHLEELKRHEWIVGWHTYSHFPLGGLSLEEQQKELTVPKEFASSPMSYPYGTEPSVTERTCELAKEFDFPCAFSNDPDFSCLRGNFYRMRFSLTSDKYDIHFQLSGLKYFLKSFKLLPKSYVEEVERQ